MHLYLIRHGQSFVNLREWDKGNVDVGLTPLGQRQAAALAGWLPSVIPTVDALYASTMLRAWYNVAAWTPMKRMNSIIGKRKTISMVSEPRSSAAPDRRRAAITDRFIT